MRIEPPSRRRLSEAARGIIPCDLVIAHVQLVNCLTGEIYPADVGILDGFFAAVSADPDRLGTSFPIEGKRVIDGQGQYLIPGFIDSHLHIESSMVTPPTMAETTLPLGTTSLVTDPHEVANVGGLEAVAYMVEASRDLPQRQYIMAPSCVPAVPELEGAGASFGAEEIEAILSMERVLGIAEVMDCAGVINRSERIEAILDAGLRRGVFLQGHAPFLSGRRLNAYLTAGIQSDHESRTGAEAREKLRLGMHVDAREGSVSTNVTAVVEAVKDFPFLDDLSLCTDDREPHDLIVQGHMNYVVARAVKAGLSPVQAIRSATLNPARELGFVNLGAVAPGWAADCQLVEDISHPRPSLVIVDGRIVAENGRLPQPIQRRTFPAEGRNTVRLTAPSLDNFKIPAPAGAGEQVRMRVLRYQSPDTSLTDLTEETVQVTDGYVDLSGRPDLKFAAVFNRHGAGTKFTAVVKDFGIREGAVASTVTHDSHNLAVVYDRPENALVAVEALMKSGGGHAAVKDGELIGLVPLPIFGLLSPLPCEKLIPTVEHQKEVLRSLGLNTKNPVMRITSLALPVIPHGKISDRGMIDVDRQEFVPLFC